MPLRSRLLSVIAAPLLGLIVGCGYYSFTGASVPSHLNTIAIPLAEDNSVNTLVNLDEDFTELLLARFVRQTRLALQPDANVADAVLTVRIERYTNLPTSVSSDETATLNRVSMNVTAIYRDRVNDEEILNRSFSAFEEYDPVEQGIEGEKEAALVVLGDIADDIFTAATSNW